jgi:hypothetical protein
MSDHRGHPGHTMTVNDVTVPAEQTTWVILDLYTSAILVLPREQFVAGLKCGKAWRRTAAGSDEVHTCTKGRSWSKC